MEGKVENRERMIDDMNIRLKESERKTERIQN